MVNQIPRPKNERMRRYRERMGERGLRPVQFWSFDTRAPGFDDAIAREMEAIRSSRDEREVLDFIERTYEWPRA